MTCKIIRSNRKSLGLEVNTEGLIIRAPLQATDAEINMFILQHKKWIERHLEQAEMRKNQVKDTRPLSQEEIRVLADKALKVIPERVKFFAPKVGVTYGRITIRNQHSRWGSCSSKGNLNFNCLLMLTPPEVIDSVVVHELCHRKEMNHSDKFYAEVLKVYPDYWKWDKWLKENGTAIMAMNGNKSTHTKQD
jgi:hypothetical protein